MERIKDYFLRIWYALKWEDYFVVDYMDLDETIIEQIKYFIDTYIIEQKALSPAPYTTWYKDLYELREAIREYEEYKNWECDDIRLSMQREEEIKNKLSELVWKNLWLLWY